MAKAARPLPAIMTKDNNHVEEGIIEVIYDTIKQNEKFSNRRFVLDTSYTYQDNIYKQYAVFQLTNHRCDLIDSHKVGDKVKVHFCVKGTGKRDNNGKPVIYTNLDVYRIESAGGINYVPYQPPADDKHQSEPEYVDDLPF